MFSHFGEGREGKGRRGEKRGKRGEEKGKPIHKSPREFRTQNGNSRVTAPRPPLCYYLVFRLLSSNVPVIFVILLDARLGEVRH